MKRRNFIAKELLTPKFKPKIVKPKKGKGSFKRQKINTSLTNKTTQSILILWLKRKQNIMQIIKNSWKR